MKNDNVAYPYILTENFKEYKKFLLQNFNPEQIGNLKGLKPIKFSNFLESNEQYNEKFDEWENFDSKVLFVGWIGKDMNKWYKFTNNKYNIELFNSYYVIHNRENIICDKYVLPYPETLNDFISDCWRCGIKLQWRKDVLEKFSSYSVYLPKVEIIDYHKMILTKLGKNV
ncbi:MAG: hypothetical protein ACOCVF_02755 [bacterium]